MPSGPERALSRVTQGEMLARKQMVQDIQRYILKNEYMNVLRVNESTTLVWPYVKNYQVGVASYESRMYFWIDGR